MKHAVAALMLLVLLLFVGACAPLPRQEAPTQPTAPPQTAEDTSSGSASTEAATPEPEPAEPAEPIENEGAVEEAVGEPVAEAPQASPPTEDRNEPVAPSKAEPDIEISGRIILSGGDADPEEAVVYFVSEASKRAPSGRNNQENAEIVTRDKSLSPTVLAVSRGSEIRFPNEDPILHNLFSVSAGNDFDLGVYGPGEAPSVKLEQAGVVNIYCNVHHDMHAHVLVVDTPFRARPDSNGNFRLTDLPAGPGELHIWHRQSDHWSQPIELPLYHPVEATLNVSKPRLPPHRDKTGQSYSRRDRDPYR